MNEIRNYCRKKQNVHRTVSAIISVHKIVFLAQIYLSMHDALKENIGKGYSINYSLIKFHLELRVHTVQSLLICIDKKKGGGQKEKKKNFSVDRCILMQFRIMQSMQAYNYTD